MMLEVIFYVSGNFFRLFPLKQTLLCLRAFRLHASWTEPNGDYSSRSEWSGILGMKNKM